MQGPGSVTRLLVHLRGGRHSAARKIFQRYYRQVTAQARLALNGGPRRVADEEDVAACVLASFFRRAQAGQYRTLADREQLRKLLTRITRYKARNLLRDLNRRKRGGVHQPAADWRHQLDQLTDGRPDPQSCAMMDEACDELLRQLDVPLRHIALQKLAGCTNQEIASALGCSLATVERRLRLIRESWQQS